MEKDKFPHNKYGADPEFSLYMKKGDYIPANKFFKGDGIIGVDGMSSTGEIRPRPNENVIYVVSDIKNILKKTAEHESMKDKEIYAGNYSGNPIGGHIHIEIPGKKEKKIELGRELIQRMDKILFDVVTCSIEDKKGLKMRQEHGYGKRGNYNEVPWGIEYRPCGSWLLSPEISLVYLGLAKMCYWSIVLDLPSYIDSFRTFLAFIDAWSEYPEDVKVALSLFKDLVKHNQEIDWETDILVKWGVR